jgi:predicted CoA-binding protein
MKKTAVIGASYNPERYSYRAIQALVQHGHETIAIGLREGTVAGINIQKKPEIGQKADTISLYVGAAHQQAWLPVILELAPRRVIFNPGSENPPFENSLLSKGIEIEHSCTLVLLATNQY